MKIAILGAGGRLGRAVMRRLEGRYELIPLDHSKVEIADLRSVQNVLFVVKPDVVINAAAWPDVDRCEMDPDGSFRVNTIGPANVASVCGRMGTILVHVSTDYVFNGLKGSPYTEFDDPSPINIYGRTKLASEKLVSELCDRYFIVRTAWLFDGVSENLVTSILKVAREKGEVRAVDDQLSSPTYTEDLVEKIMELIETPLYGTYHIVNEGVLSRYDIARKILGIAGMGSIKIIPISSEEVKKKAPRPKNSALTCYRLRLQGFQTLRPFDEALEDVLAQSLFSPS